VRKLLLVASVLVLSGSLGVASLFASSTPSFARVRNYPTGPEPDAVALGSSSARGREGTARSTDGAYALAAGRDGKLVAAGFSRRGNHEPRFALARYTAGGTLDRRFGTGGKVLTGFGGAQSYARATSLAIRPAGKIVVAGSAVLPPRITSLFALARYTVSGKLDRAFGRNGRVLTSFGSRARSSAQALAISADGKVVAVGYCDCRRFRFALARYTPRGRLDRTFGRGGKVVTDFGARSSAEAAAVAIQPDGKIVVAGDATRTRTDFALARYYADGTLDRSFGTGGRVVSKVGDGFSYAAAIVVQPDGKLVVAGRAYVKPDGVFALVRYSADGKLDPSFGHGGIVVTNGNAWALAIQRDRKLVAAGNKGPRFALARFLEDGSLDETFGRDGKLLTDFHALAEANAVVVRADGKIIAAGIVGASPWRDFALARYTSSGRLDGNFGSGGKVLTDFGSLWAIRDFRTVLPGGGKINLVVSRGRRHS
jgi:uncharacterized delta-60 repeat protein